MTKLFGMVCAAITPLLPDGTLDEASLKSLTKHLIESGIDGIYSCGTTGESLLLSKEERQKATEITSLEGKNKCSVYAQVTALTEKETSEHIEHAKRIGIDGIGIMTPVFFGYNQKTLEAFFDEMLSLAGDLPVYLYNIPQFTHNDILPGTFFSLSKKHQNLVGIKYSHPNDLKRVQDYLSGVDRPTDLLIGCDRLMLQAFVSGAAGTITGAAAVFPKRFTNLYRAFQNKEMGKAANLQKKIAETYMKMEGIPQIPALKALLKMMGMIAHDTCKKPFLPLSKEELHTLEEVLNESNADAF